MIPKIMNKGSKSPIIHSDVPDEVEKLDVTWLDLLSNRHVVFSMITCIFGLYGCMFFSAFLGNELKDLYDLDPKVTGYVLST